MKNIILLSDDKTTLFSLSKIIKEEAETIQVESYESLEDFVKNLESFKQPETASDFVETQVIFCDVHLLGGFEKVQTSIEKLTLLLDEKKLRSESNPTRLVLMTYEMPNINLESFAGQKIFNILVRPFDKDLLTQQIKLTITGYGKPSDSDLYTQQISRFVEMIKDIQICEVSEIGFKTKSDREIPTQSFAKYYMDFLNLNGSSSVYARCVRSVPPAGSENLHTAEFVFLGMPNEKIALVRKTLFQDSKKKKAKAHEIKHNENSAKQKINALFLTSDFQNLESSIEAISERFNNVNILKELPDNTAIDVVFLSYTLAIGETYEKETTELLKKIENQNKAAGKTHEIPLFVVVKDTLSSSQKETLLGLFTDIVFEPLERIYFLKRMQLWLPNLNAVEPLAITDNPVVETISVATPVELIEISETSFNVKYNRVFKRSEIRKVRLSGDDGFDSPVIFACCIFSEKESDHYTNRFLNFGATDKITKYIRKWMLENYVKQKSK